MSLLKWFSCFRFLLSLVVFVQLRAWVLQFTLKFSLQVIFYDEVWQKSQESKMFCSNLTFLLKLLWLCWITHMNFWLIPSTHIMTHSVITVNWEFLLRRFFVWNIPPRKRLRVLFLKPPYFTFSCKVRDWYSRLCFDWNYVVSDIDIGNAK